MDSYLPTFPIEADANASMRASAPSREFVLRVQQACFEDSDVWARITSFMSSTKHPARNLEWLKVLTNGLRHRTFILEATQHGKTVGVLPLAEVKSLLFGKFLVSLPYLNQGGVHAESGHVAQLLVDEAVALADTLDVRYLELRHETELEHPKLTEQISNKVHMRLGLPSSSESLWSHFKSKLRSQIRSGEKHGFTVHWGGAEMIPDFYKVFSRNMRDLGTPVIGMRFFESIAAKFPGDAEFCCVRTGATPIASALVVHGGNTTEVPSASSLREFRSSNPNMVMYWNLLQRAIERGSQVFDFGRSTMNEGTFAFKQQWGANPSPAVWQYYVRKGPCDAMRPDNNKFSMAIGVWKRLPLALTNYLGPRIVRGIP